MHQITLKFLRVLPVSFTSYKFLPSLKQIIQRNDMLIGTIKFKIRHTMKSTPPPRILPVLQRVKSLYILWYDYYQTIPKIHRHSLGQRIDTLFVETIEAISIASFLSKEEKQPWVRLAVRKVDTIKILMMVLWETKSLDNKKYIALSTPLEEIGRMLGGWQGQISAQLSKQNSPAA